jgi:hypothetical protein
MAMSSRALAVASMSVSLLEFLPPSATLPAATMPVMSAIEDSDHMVFADDDKVFALIRKLLASAKVDVVANKQVFASGANVDHNTRLLLFFGSQLKKRMFFNVTLNNYAILGGFKCHFFLAVLAESLKSLADGAALLPTLFIFSFEPLAMRSCLA